MNTTTTRIATGLAVLMLTLATGTAAHAQYVPPGGYQAWSAYQRQSQANWEARRQYFLGPMNPVTKVVYTATNAARTALHVVRRTIGDPDYGYYDRFDRTPVVNRGPNPYGGAYAGYGWANGYTNPVMNRPISPVQQMPAPVQYYQATPQASAYRPTYGYGVNLFGR